MMNLSAQHILAFHRDGVVRVAAAVDDAWIEKLRAAIERGLGRSENYFRRHTLWNADEDLKAFCFNSVAPRLAIALLESNKLNLLYDQIFVKEPGSGAATPWHNDQPYWPVRGWSVSTVWIALDQITAESGAMEFIRGSHRWNRWFQPFLAASDGGKAGDYEHNAEYEILPNFDACRDELDIVSWDMQPGDTLVFHALIVHGARANHSRHRRRGYAIRYTGDDAVYYEGKAVNPRLISARLKPGEPLDSPDFPIIISG